MTTIVDAKPGRPISVSTIGNSKYADNFEKVNKNVYTEDKVFTIHHCDSCHIKVSTSNGKCPSCGKEL